VVGLTTLNLLASSITNYGREVDQSIRLEPIPTSQGIPKAAA
jgi:hypothetical protein